MSNGWSHSIFQWSWKSMACPTRIFLPSGSKWHNGQMVRREQFLDPADLPLGHCGFPWFCCQHLKNMWAIQCHRPIQQLGTVFVLQPTKHVMTWAGLDMVWLLLALPLFEIVYHIACLIYCGATWCTTHSCWQNNAIHHPPDHRKIGCINCLFLLCPHDCTLPFCKHTTKSGQSHFFHGYIYFFCGHFQ